MSFVYLLESIGNFFGFGVVGAGYFVGLFIILITMGVTGKYTGSLSSCLIGIVFTIIITGIGLFDIFTGIIASILIFSLLILKFGK